MNANRRNLTLPRKLQLRTLFAAFALFVIGGCGGGSSGTGTRTFHGTVETKSDQPLPGVAVSIVDTGDGTITDANGAFDIISEAVEGPVTFRLESDKLNTEFVINPGPGSSSQVQLEVQVDEEQNFVSSARNLAAYVGFVGKCDPYFENSDPIRQANQVPPDTECTLSIRVTGDGRLIPNVPIGLERSSCPEAAPWEQIGRTTTGSSGVELGVGEITFQYNSTRRSCRYRVLVPYAVPGAEPLEFKIITFEQQRN